jgi:tetratricopeptide (TPR) repeat protein
MQPIKQIRLLDKWRKIWRIGKQNIGMVSALSCAICLSFAVEARADEGALDTRVRQLNQAIQAAQNGRLDDALKIDEELLRHYPALVPALKLHGALLEQMGRAQEAEDAYAQALRLAPRDADLLMKRALIALRRADDPMAIEELKRYCQMRPSDADAYFYLAQALHRDGQPGEALKSIHQAIRLDRGRAEFLQKLGEWLTTAGNPKDGVTYLEQAQRIDPLLDQIEFDLGLAAYYDLDYIKAAMMAKAALSRAPGDRKAIQLRASSLEQLSDWQ